MNKDNNSYVIVYFFMFFIFFDGAAQGFQDADFYKITSVASEKFLAFPKDVYYPILSDAVTYWKYEPKEYGYGRLIHIPSNLDLGFDTSTKKLAFLFLSDSEKGESRHWKLIEHEDGTVSFINKFNGWALDVLDEKKALGSFVTAYPYHGRFNQRWKKATHQGRKFFLTSVSAKKIAGSIVGAW